LIGKKKESKYHFVYGFACSFFDEGGIEIKHLNAGLALAELTTAVMMLTQRRADTFT